MELCDIKECTGCLACKQACPQKAISLINDNMGFQYPVIADELCVNCGKCRSVCHVCSKITNVNEPKSLYRYKGPDQIRLESSSGGFFTLISNYFLKKGYHIIGVVFDDDYYGAHYEIADSFERVKLMRKSKYIEAKTDLIYEKATDILKHGGKMLFTGLPCQIAGFLKYINGKYDDQIVTVDLLCFGNGSSYIYKRSLQKFVEQNTKSGLLKKVDFRHKPFTERVHTIMDIVIDDELFTLPANDFPYYRGYVNRLVFRESCYKCMYHSFSRITDFTIADVPENLDPMGESMILCNTQKSINIIRELESIVDNNSLKIVDDNLMLVTKEKLSRNRVKPKIYNQIHNCNNIDLVISDYLNLNVDINRNIALAFCKKVFSKFRRVIRK